MEALTIIEITLIIIPKGPNKRKSVIDVAINAMTADTAPSDESVPLNKTLAPNPVKAPVSVPMSGKPTPTASVNPTTTPEPTAAPITAPTIPSTRLFDSFFGAARCAAGRALNRGAVAAACTAETGGGGAGAAAGA